MTAFDGAALREVAAILRDAARAEIMPRFRKLAEGAIRTKTGPLDLVTDADEAAERVITVALRGRFPGCHVVGEEATAADPAMLDGLAEAPLAFVVDPVDGTANFDAGLPAFGFMAAAFRKGEVVAAWIHDPLEPQRSHVAARMARRAGAWILRCAAHEHRPIAGGHAHLSLYHRLMPWDHAPGWFLYREAGGYAARFDGTP